MLHLLHPEVVPPFPHICPLGYSQENTSLPHCRAVTNPIPGLEALPRGHSWGAHNSSPPMAKGDVQTGRTPALCSARPACWSKGLQWSWEQERQKRKASRNYSARFNRFMGLFYYFIGNLKQTNSVDKLLQRAGC